MLQKRKSNKKGFTLIELLVTITLVGILSAISLALLKPSFFYGKGRDANRKSDLETVRGALEQYYLDKGRVYPSGVGFTYSDLETPLGDYLDMFPTDPGSNTYVYTVSADQKCYELSVVLETETTPANFTICGGSLSCQKSQTGGANGGGFCQ